MHQTYNPATGEIAMAGHMPERHPNQDRTQAELIERCQSVEVKDGACPHSKTCQASGKCPFGAEYKKAQRNARLSKVCALANGMPRSMPRKEAFAKAWAIAKNGGLEISVAGVSFGSRQEALRRLASYDPESVIALLVPEPDCEHDPGAIAVKVMVKGGKGIYTIGYIPRPYAAVARAFLGRVPRLELVGGETKGARIRLAA